MSSVEGEGEEKVEEGGVEGKMEEGEVEGKMEKKRNLVISLVVLLGL